MELALNSKYTSIIKNSIDSFEKGGMLDIDDKKHDKYGFEYYPK